MSPGSTFYDKTTPDDRRKIDRCLVDRMPATYKAVFEKFNLRAKNVSFSAFYNYARKIRDAARQALLANLIVPDAKESAQVAMRLAASECVDALLHPEEEGSAKKLAKNERIYSRFRRHELAADRTAAIREVAHTRRASTRECTELRTQAQRDCTDMRGQTQRDVTNIRAENSRHLNERRIKTQRDIAQFRADVMAARHNALYPSAETAQPPPSVSTSRTPVPSAEPVICSDRFPLSAAPDPTNSGDEGDLSLASPIFGPRPLSAIRNPNSAIPAAPSSSTSNIPHPPSAISSDSLEYWLNLRRCIREIYGDNEGDYLWAPRIREALNKLPPDERAPRLKQALLRDPLAPPLDLNHDINPDDPVDHTTPIDPADPHSPRSVDPSAPMPAPADLNPIKNWSLLPFPVTPDPLDPSFPQSLNPYSHPPTPRSPGPPPYNPRCDDPACPMCDGALEAIQSAYESKLRAERLAKLERFYDDHPNRRPAARGRQTSGLSTSVSTDERSESAHTEPEAPATGSSDQRPDAADSPLDPDPRLNRHPHPYFHPSSADERRESPPTQHSELSTQDSPPRRLPSPNRDPFLPQIRNPHISAPW